MRPLYRILLIGLLFPALATAQQNQGSQGTQRTEGFTLEQCIQYALENSVNMKNAAIDEKIADARVKETRGIGLPQIDAAVGVQYNQKLRRFFAVYDTASLFFQGQEVAGLEVGDVVAGQNFFQLKSGGDASLTITQIIFNGSYLVGLKAANAYRDLAVKAKEQTQEQTVQQVAKAYYAVLINRDRMNLFDNNIARVDSLLRTTRALHENGFAESIDVDRIQVALNNLKSERNKFYNIQELSQALLKFQMNYPMGQEIEVIGEIASLQVDENVMKEYALNWDYSQRADYRLLEANRKLQSLDVKNKYAASMPSLTAFANLGYATQSNSIGGVFKTESNPNAAYPPGFGPDKWYSYSLLGVNLNIPIFSGLQRNYRLQQSKLSLMKVENGFTTLKSAIDLEVKQAAINYLNAISTLKSQNENRALAENIARVTKIKYEQGVGSNLEVIDAESSLREAQINYYNALYDALVAKVDLDKAYGKLLPQTTQENK